ncbi:MAG: asparagine--tRNA ligase [Candidatus Korarchaeota archaeon]|nr:asparagine--tRNA ligase [Thermoproteota archaeon]
MAILSGWIYRKREFGRKLFVDLRPQDSKDYLGRIIQIVFDAAALNQKDFDLIKSLGQESFISVEGEFVNNPRAPGGIELHAHKLLTYYPAEKPYPLAKKRHSPEFLLDVRHLTIRSPRYQRMWLIREAFVDYLREWYKKNGWVEVYPPILTFTACEGGATLFALDYFGQKGYLSQSAQLYLEVLIYSLGKVFSLTPSFRAEKSRTRRHLAEFWHFEAEAAMCRFEDILVVEEESLAYALRKILEDERFYEWIKEFRGNMEILDGIRTPFPRLTYDEVIQRLQAKGVQIEWGQDLGADEEQIISSELDTPFFITLYPTQIKAFYVKAYEGDEKKCKSADMMAPEGYGEITTGGEREDRIDVLIDRLKKEGWNPQDYFWYLDLRKYGSVPHSGFGLGIERTLTWLLKLDHIRESIPFPRLARRKTLV